MFYISSIIASFLIVLYTFTVLDIHGISTFINTFVKINLHTKVLEEKQVNVIRFFTTLKNILVLVYHLAYLFYKQTIHPTILLSYHRLLNFLYIFIVF